MRLPQPHSPYSRPPAGPPLRRVRLWNITTWLIAINVAVFVANILARGLLDEFGYFSVDTAFRHLQLWRLITFQFLHADVFHIFFNMLALYYFGPLVEQWLGRARYLAFYLLCGMAGAAMYVILWRVGLVISSGAVPLIGASAGVFGVLVACVKIAPNMLVRMIFPPVDLRMVTLAWIFIGIAVLTILQKGPNAGGEAGHLGGAFAGWILASNYHWLNVFDRQRRSRKRFWRPGDSAKDFFRHDA
jgi:membrane associated rhomboid family serine protease